MRTYLFSGFRTFKLRTIWQAWRSMWGALGWASITSAATSRAPASTALVTCCGERRVSIATAAKPCHPSTRAAKWALLVKLCLKWWSNNGVPVSPLEALMFPQGSTSWAEIFFPNRHFSRLLPCLHHCLQAAILIARTRPIIRYNTATAALKWLIAGTGW